MYVEFVVSVERRDSQRRVDHGGPEHRLRGCERSGDDIEAVVARLVIVVGLDADFEVPHFMVGAEAYGPSPAGDVELIDPLLPVVAALDPQFTLQVRSDIAELQQVLTRATRGEHQPVFIIARVDRAKLGVVVDDTNSHIGAVVRLEDIRASHLGPVVDGSLSLLYAQEIAAHIVTAVGQDSEFEVADGRVDLQEDFAVPASGDLELFDAPFLIFPGLDPEFAFEVGGNVCNLQEVFPGQAGYEHDPIFVSIGVYRVKLRLACEDMHRQIAFGVGFEFVNSRGLEDFGGLRLRLDHGLGLEDGLRLDHRLRLWLKLLLRLVELGVERQIAVVAGAHQSYLPPSLCRHRQGDPFVAII